MAVSGSVSTYVSGQDLRISLADRQYQAMKLTPEFLRVQVVLREVYQKLSQSFFRQEPSPATVIAWVHLSLPWKVRLRSPFRFPQ